jgi:hypothetical protein
LIWIKKCSNRPIPGPAIPMQPSVSGHTADHARRSGLHRILGFHWRTQRGSAPMSRGDPPGAMSGRPDPTGKPPGLFGAMRQGSGGVNTGPSFGGGGNAAFFPPRGNQDSIASGSSTAGFGFNAGPQGNLFQQPQGGMAIPPSRCPLRAG